MMWPLAVVGVGCWALIPPFSSLTPSPVVVAEMQVRTTQQANAHFSHVVHRWHLGVLWSSKHPQSTLRAVACSGGGGCQVPSSSCPFHCHLGLSWSLSRSSSSSSPVVIVPLSSIISSSCPGPCRPAIILIVVGVPHCLGPLCLGFLIASSSPPSSPIILLLLVVLILVSVPLSFSPSLVIVVPVSSPGLLSTLRAEARSGGVGVSSCCHLVVASQLFSLPSLSASSLSPWLLASSSLSPLS